MSEARAVITITGATGFIGRRLAVRLAGRFTLRCLVRDAARAKVLLPDGVELIQGDMTDLASLKTAVSGASVVVHLAARKSDEPDIEAVNVGGAANLVEACREAGVRRVVNVGSQAARMSRRGAYGDTKAKSDEILNASGLDVTTLLPSVVYGPNDPGVFGKLARATASPIVPVIGDGRARYQPVHVDDLCAAIEGCFDAPIVVGKTYSVGGPDSITLEELIDLVAARRGRSPIKIHLPGPVAMLIATVLSHVFKTPPLSKSNVLGAIQSVPDADYVGIFAELGLPAPRPLSAGIADSV